MSNSDRLTVQTRSGAVRGFNDGKMDKFFGIPYADAPTGELRFRTPRPHPGWTGTLDADHFGTISPQPDQRESEDCLYLNVYRPATLSSSSQAPVYVYIHGGGFFKGAGSIYDGTAIALTAGAIFVTFNYRQGLFGFLSATCIEDEIGSSGNYGVEDVRAAVAWVKENIKAFGGDPDNITLGGESAGAMMTGMLIASGVDGLFNRAIIQDGPPAYNLPTLGQKYQEHAQVLRLLNLDGKSSEEQARVLRSGDLSVEALLKVQESMPFGVFHPSCGGTAIPSQPRAGVGRVPMLMGFDEYEVFNKTWSFRGRLGNVDWLNPKTDDEYVRTLSLYYGMGDAKVIADAYPLQTFANGNWALNKIESDCGNYPGSQVIAIVRNIETFELAAKPGLAPCFAYEFNDPDAGDDAFTGNLGDAGGPVHTSELPYLFPHGSLSSVLPKTESSKRLSGMMIQYWANFVKNGDPNGQGLPEWPRYRSGTDVLQLVPEAVHAGEDVLANHRYAMWKILGYVG